MNMLNIWRTNSHSNPAQNFSWLAASYSSGNFVNTALIRSGHCSISRTNGDTSLIEGLGEGGTDDDNFEKEGGFGGSMSIWWWRKIERSVHTNGYSHQCYKLRHLTIARDIIAIFHDNQHWSISNFVYQGTGPRIMDCIDWRPPLSLLPSPPPLFIGSFSCVIQRSDAGILLLNIFQPACYGVHPYEALSSPRSGNIVILQL